MVDAATIRMRTMSHPDCRPASRFGRLSGQPGMSRSRALRARALAGRDRRKPYPVIVTSRCDDRVRRSSKSEGGSNPVLTLRLLDCFALLAMTGRGQRKPHPVIARSPRDDRVRRSSKSEGGSNPVLPLRPLDCFALLAMTGTGQRKPHLVIARSAGAGRHEPVERLRLVYYPLWHVTPERWSE